MNEPRITLGIIVILLGIGILTGYPVGKVLFALLFIWLGLRLLTGKTGRMGLATTGISGEDSINRVAIFSGFRQKLTSTDFRGGEVVAIFGSGELDLSEVKVKRKDIELNLVAIFGGVKVRVPQNWAVNTEGVGIIGGFDNRTNSSGKGDVVATIKGVSILGGVELADK